MLKKVDPCNDFNFHDVLFENYVMRPVFKVPVLLFSVVGLLIASCSKPVKSEGSTGIVGDWQWVSTNGGIAAHINETPASTGKQIELKLTADNKYSLYINGVLTTTGTYGTRMHPCIHGQGDKQKIDFSGSGYYERDVVVHKADQVYLESCDNAYDGVTYLYTRK